MDEMLVYKTAEEAEKELEKYTEWNINWNEEFNNEWHKHDRKMFSVAKLNEIDEIKKLRSQKRYFVAELMVHDGQYHSSATSFPFQSVNGPHGVSFCSHKSIFSLVQGVKSTIEGLSENYPTIETVFYTVQNHDEHNQTMKKECFKSLGFFDGEARGLSEQERKEFVRLYQGK